MEQVAKLAVWKMGYLYVVDLSATLEPTVPALLYTVCRNAVIYIEHSSFPQFDFFSAANRVEFCLQNTMHFVTLS